MVFIEKYKGGMEGTFKKVISEQWGRMQMKKKSGEREKRENSGVERGGGGSEKAAREPHMEVIL